MSRVYKLLLAGMLVWAALNAVHAQRGTTTLTRLAPTASAVNFNLNSPYVKVQVRLTNHSPFRTTYEQVKLVYRETRSLFEIDQTRIMSLVSQNGNEYIYEVFLPVFAEDERILKSVQIDVMYCDTNVHNHAYDCYNFRFTENLPLSSTDGFLVQVRAMDDPANCGNNPPIKTGLFANLGDNHGHCAIVNPTPQGELVFQSGDHILGGENLHGVRIEDDIRVMPGARVFIDAQNSVGLRGNIVIEPGGFLQVRANTIAMDNSEEDSSVPTSELMIHSGGVLKAYADDFLYFTMNAEIYNGLLRMVGTTVKMYPRFELSEVLVRQHGILEVEFCEQLDLHHKVDVANYDTKAVFYSPNENGSFIIHYTPVKLSDFGTVQMKAGKIFTRGDMQVQGNGGTLLLETFAGLVFEASQPNVRPVPNLDFADPHLNGALGIGEAITLTEVGLYVYFSDPNTCEDSYSDTTPLPLSTSKINEGEVQAQASALHLSVYPNPMKDRATVSFSLPKASEVTFAIYDPLGRQVYQSKRQMYQAGENQWTWEAQSASSRPISAGVYQLLLLGADLRQSTPLIITK